MVAPGQGHPRRGRELRHDQAPLRRHRRREHGGQPPRLPRAAVPHRRAPTSSSAASSSTTRRSARRAPTARRWSRSSQTRASSPASRSTPAPSRWPAPRASWSPRAWTACASASPSTTTLGARFSKWRAVITIGDGIPSHYCIEVNAHALARYAALSQEAGIVPIVEPEVLAWTATTRSSAATRSRAPRCASVFAELARQRVAAGRHAPQAEHGALRQQGVQPRPGRRGRAPDGRLLQGDACRRRCPASSSSPAASPTTRRRSTWTPINRDAAKVGGALGAQLLLRPRPAGGAAEGLVRQGGERRGGPEGLLPPRQGHVRGAPGQVLAWRWRKLAAV